MSSTTMKRKVEGALGAGALSAAQHWLRNKTIEQAEVTGIRLGRIIMKASKSRRQRCLSNLKLAFPEMTLAERSALCQRVFEHYGIVTCDFLMASRRTPEMLEASVDVRGFEHVTRGLELGKGLIMITGHFGNWERLSAWISLHGYTLSVVARDTHNERINHLVNDLRSTTGTKVIPRGNAARPIIESLRRNELVGILPDQNSDEAFIPFFGHPCGTVLGPGVISERTESPVIPAWCVRVGPGKYEMTFQPPLAAEPSDGPKGEGMMRAINLALENQIRKYPEQWLWFHDRWRSARRQGLLSDTNGS
ncbi:MAG: lysophospholipid acyltransferase family protein [Armatimonadetes bacterium]|nr:lysophospholipid acyltransferase family protein [Armatimonadota bacterium]